MEPFKENSNTPNGNRVKLRSYESINLEVVWTRPKRVVSKPISEIIQQAIIITYIHLLFILINSFFGYSASCKLS